MTHIVLVMHAPLGTALASCAEHVYGKKPEVTIFDVDPCTIPEEATLRLLDILRRAPHEGALILCDLIGATPFNIAQAAIKAAAGHGVTAHLVTGTNLGMLLKALATRHETPARLKEEVRLGALRGIISSEDTS